MKIILFFISELIEFFIDKSNCKFFIKFLIELSSNFEILKKFSEKKISQKSFLLKKSIHKVEKINQEGK